MTKAQTAEVVETVEATVVETVEAQSQPVATPPANLPDPVRTPKAFELAKNMEEQLAWAETVVDSGITPFNSPEAVVTAMMFADSLNMKATVALQHIHVIGGKATMSHTMVGALLAQHGIIIEWPEDFVMVNTGTEEKPVWVNRTTVKFIHMCPLRKKIVEKTSSTTYQQFMQQGLTSKENWQKMPKQMMRARTLTDGARKYFPDIFMGLAYTTEEIVDATGDENVLYDEEGNVIEINATIE